MARRGGPQDTTDVTDRTGPLKRGIMVHKWCAVSDEYS